MFEKLEYKITTPFQVIVHYTNEKLWYESEEVYSNDFERVENYITTSQDLKRLCAVGFYPYRNTIKLSFSYNIKSPRPVDQGLFHHRAFVKPPIDLLMALYKFVPNDVYDFIIKCRNKYDIKQLSYNAGTWLMAILLGSRNLD